MDLDRWVEMLNELVKSWENFCSAIQDAANAMEELWKKIWPVVYEKKTTPNRYTAKMRKDRIYRTRVKPHQHHYNNLRNQPYCRRTF